MDLLTIEHQDFTLSVECPGFERVWDKAKCLVGMGNENSDALKCVYSWSDTIASVTRDGVALICGEKGSAVFFDETDYHIWVDFATDVEYASVNSFVKKDNEKFSFRKQKSILAGTINFGNDIGKSCFSFIYWKGGIRKTFSFVFTVLSTKLDYNEQWKAIVHDIENEYRLLSLAYLRSTFHSFTPDQKGDTPDLIWWNIFEREQNAFIKACKSIISRPRRQLKGTVTYLRADQLKYLPASLEREYAENKDEPSYKYRVEERVQSNDTPENQFVKFAINQISRKFASLKKHIIKDQLPSEKKESIDQMEVALKHLQSHPFFRTVGPFRGLNQENLVLQRASGYSQVYRTWNLLRRVYSLNDGLYQLQTKDIATLYEIWCLIKVADIVKRRLEIGDEDVENANRCELNGVFTRELEKGEESRILFRKDGVRLVELFYNPTYNKKGHGDHGLIVPTVVQKPDIVLQLTKSDISDDKILTYLFDAKYRIGERRKDGNDAPPEDTINQMHRYRDAIYYKHRNLYPLRKEVIGGYILFPGYVDPAFDISKIDYFASIDEVNIGAFPLRPNDISCEILEEFIGNLIDTDGMELLDKTIPQKGLYYTSKQEGDSVIVACVENDGQLSWVKSNNEFGLCTDEGKEGSVKPFGPFAHAQYLILYKKGEKKSTDFFHLTGEYSIKTKEELNGCPDLSGDSFLALRFDSDIDPNYDGLEWDLSSQLFVDANGKPIIVKCSYLLRPE